MFNFDLLKLPETYRFNEDGIKNGKYIDDGSLLLYNKVAQGWFSRGDGTMSFLWGNVIGWSSKDFVAYLLKIAKEYNLKIENIEVIWGAVEDEYEEVPPGKENQTEEERQKELMSYFLQMDTYNKDVEKGLIDKSDIATWIKEVHKFNPSHFGSSYSWALDEVVKKSDSEFSKLFSRLRMGQGTSDDIEKILIYANRTVPGVVKMDSEKEMEALHSKGIMGNVLSYLSFSISMTEDDQRKIDADITAYLTNFSQDKLERLPARAYMRVQDASIVYPNNILSFKAHKKTLTEHLLEMMNEYGNTFRLSNIFEEPYTYDDRDLTSEEIVERYRNKDFLFIHCVLAFRKLGFLKIKSISTNWDALDVKPLSYECSVEIQPLLTGEEDNHKLYFDDEKSRFYVQGNEIKIKKFGDEYHLLNALFRNSDEIGKEWFFSEIAELVDQANPNDKKYYNAAYQLGLKLSKISINDFITTTRQSMKINHKYLS